MKTQLMTCNVCRGRKRMLGMGMVEEVCTNCTGLGYTEVKLTVDEDGVPRYHAPSPTELNQSNTVPLRNRSNVSDMQNHQLTQPSGLQVVDAPAEINDDIEDLPAHTPGLDDALIETMRRRGITAPPENAETEVHSDTLSASDDAASVQANSIQVPNA